MYAVHYLSSSHIMGILVVRNGTTGVRKQNKYFSLIKIKAAA